MEKRPIPGDPEDDYVPDDPDVLENELLNLSLSDGYAIPSIPEVGMRSVLDAVTGTEEIEELHRREEYYDPEDYLWGDPYYGLR